MDGRRLGGFQDWQNKEDQVWKEYCEFMVGRVDFEVFLVGLLSMYLDICGFQLEMLS